MDKRLLKILSRFSVLFFLVSCSNEYFDYHSDNSFFETQLSAIKKDKDIFDLGKIKELNPEITILPDEAMTLDKIVDKIRGSKKRVYLEVYILTEKRIISELLAAKNRWLDVRVILEKNVLWSPSINNKTFKTLKDSWIEVYYASDKNYVFTHSKFFITDDSYIIWTWNMSHSTFYKNKEFYVFDDNPKNLWILERVFDDDTKWIKSVYCSENIIVSPSCSRLAFEKALWQARENIYIYAQEISDFSFEKIIKEKALWWIKIKMILANPKIVKWNQKIIDEFKGDKNISIYIPKKFYIHAKVFVVDNKAVYIGSINFTSNSMDNNREAWIIFNNEDSWKKIIKQFSYDISQ